MSNIGKTLLAGHALQDEGKAHYTDEGLFRWDGGRAMCECGALAPKGVGVRAAQRWHREHKDSLRQQAAQ